MSSANNSLSATCMTPTPRRIIKNRNLSTRYAAGTRLHAGRKRQRLSPIVSPTSSRACYVAVSDILNTPESMSSVLSHKLSCMQADLLETKAKLTELEAQLIPLLPLTYILTSPCSADQECLRQSAKLVDCIATEIYNRIRCNRQVLIYNVPDRFPAEQAKQAILQISGLANRTCRSTRLRKSCPEACCPILLEFDDDLSPLMLINKQALLPSHPKLANAKIMPARTRMQRELFRALIPAPSHPLSAVQSSTAHLSVVGTGTYPKIGATNTTTPEVIAHSDMSYQNSQDHTSATIPTNVSVSHTTNMCPNQLATTLNATDKNSNSCKASATTTDARSIAPGSFPDADNFFNPGSFLADSVNNPKVPLSNTSNSASMLVCHENPSHKSVTVDLSETEAGKSPANRLVNTTRSCAAVCAKTLMSTSVNPECDTAFLAGTSTDFPGSVVDADPLPNLSDQINDVISDSLRCYTRFVSVRQSTPTSTLIPTAPLVSQPSDTCMTTGNTAAACDSVALLSPAVLDGKNKFLTGKSCHASSVHNTHLNARGLNTSLNKPATKSVNARPGAYFPKSSSGHQTTTMPGMNNSNHSIPSLDLRHPAVPHLTKYRSPLPPVFPFNVPPPSPVVHNFAPIHSFPLAPFPPRPPPHAVLHSWVRPPILQNSSVSALSLIIQLLPFVHSPPLSPHMF
jgi:hypothetical protein